MKKVNLLFIIILSTFTSLFVMVNYNKYEINSINYVESKLLEQGLITRVNKKDVKEATNSDGETSNAKNYFKSSNILQEELSSQCKSEDERGSNNLNMSLSNENAQEESNGRDKYIELHSRLRIDKVEDYYNYKENEQSVFKISTGKIIENLTISDKARLLYASMQLGKEDYNKVEEYLYEDNAEDGVLKALKLLRGDLSEKEYKKVRKIAAKFIDMDAVESLY
jgi:hypothetical protein